MAKIDYIEVANKKTLEGFEESYFPGPAWTTWIHPATKQAYTLTLQTAPQLSSTDFNACFELIEFTSSDDYRKSKDGWKPKAKKKEMRLLDLKYLLVKRGDEIVGFLSFMPTYEDEKQVVYCYEVHLGEEVRGTGLGGILMGHLITIAKAIPLTEKVMLTVFTRNEHAVAFYAKLGYEKDEYSPEPRLLRNGTVVESLKSKFCSCSWMDVCKPE
ncbi:uncharacterized protein RAG0_16637 [Rhynchosporium agropyri]|uniref:N-alpha-acetyltransferase 40 n=1 Tax=Rhynchosporium agropyri TaxID=914238 RepID=A0A1E1LRC8_9HELO|nr:uncharacterized protein RAG0_16637 [Rhynchosporium agropyri]